MVMMKVMAEGLQIYVSPLLFPSAKNLHCPSLAWPFLFSLLRAREGGHLSSPVRSTLSFAFLSDLTGDLYDRAQDPGRAIDWLDRTSSFPIPILTTKHNLMNLVVSKGMGKEIRNPFYIPFPFFHPFILVFHKGIQLERKSSAFMKGRDEGGGKGDQRSIREPVIG